MQQNAIEFDWDWTNMKKIGTFHSTIMKIFWENVKYQAQRPFAVVDFLIFKISIKFCCIWEKLMETCIYLINYEQDTW